MHILPAETQILNPRLGTPTAKQTFSMSLCGGVYRPCGYAEECHISVLALSSLLVPWEQDQVTRDPSDVKLVLLAYLHWPQLTLGFRFPTLKMQWSCSIN